MHRMSAEAIACQALSKKTFIKRFPKKSCLPSVYAVGTELIINKILDVIAVIKLSSIANCISLEQLLVTSVGTLVWVKIHII